MKKFRVFVLILLLAIAVPGIVRYRAWAFHSQQPGAQLASSQIAASEIVSPKPDQKLAQSFVVVEFRTLNPVFGSGESYELRLDGRDAVHTTEHSYTFNGLTPGTHEVALQVLATDGIPASGTGSLVSFVVDPATAAKVGGTQAANLPEPPLPLPPPADLPNVNSSLPLLSIIGFGILVGGVISALRTRPAHK